jgi:phosphomannomutase
MVPWLLVVELISKSGRSLGDWTRDRFEKFQSSGEINFTVQDACASIARVGEAYKDQARSIDEMDGLSFDCDDWRFNLRKSNTEPLVRLNLEARGNAGRLEQRIAELSAVIAGR